MTIEQPIPIFEGQDFYVPYFQVKIGPRELDREVIYDITQVSYKDSLQEVDSFEITINNWDARTRTFKYSDRKLFDPGQRVELWMGYFGGQRLRPMLTGEITSLRPSFPSGGQPTLAISGQNLLHRLRRKQESHSYKNMTDSQIARRVAGRLNIPIDINENAAAREQPYEYVLQHNQYDILFLIERARRIGYDIYVKEQGQQQGNNLQAQPSKLVFGPSVNVERKLYELEYGKSLIDFQPTLTTANQVGSVTVRGWDAVRKKAITVTATRDQLETKGVGQAGGQAEINRAFNEREEIIVDRPVNSEQEAKTLAKETLERIAKDMVKGSGTTIGLPDLRAGSVIYLWGLGERFSGRYFVTGTTHTIGDGGYTTKFECRREELKEQRNGRSAN